MDSASSLTVRRTCGLTLGRAWRAWSRSVARRPRFREACPSRVPPQRRLQMDPDDARLWTRVRTALVNDPQLGAEPIRIDVTDGTVTLTGSVTTATLANHAVEVVRRVSGVRHVTSSLVVGPVVVGRDRPGRLPSLAGGPRRGPLRVLGLGARRCLRDHTGWRGRRRNRRRPHRATPQRPGLGAVDRLQLDPHPPGVCHLGAGEPLADLVVRPVMVGCRVRDPAGPRVDRVLGGRRLRLQLAAGGHEPPR